MWYTSGAFHQLASHRRHFGSESRPLGIVFFWTSCENTSRLRIRHEGCPRRTDCELFGFVPVRPNWSPLPIFREQYSRIGPRESCQEGVRGRELPLSGVIFSGAASSMTAHLIESSNPRTIKRLPLGTDGSRMKALCEVSQNCKIKQFRLRLQLLLRLECSCRSTLQQLPIKTPRFLSDLIQSTSESEIQTRFVK